MIPGTPGLFGPTDPPGTPWHALAVGEPRAAAGVLDDPAVTPERRAALGWLLHVLEWGRAPGPIGFLPLGPTPPGPGEPESSDDIPTAWWGRLLPYVLQLRSCAVSGRRPGEAQARAIHANLLMAVLPGCELIARRSGDATVVARVLLEAAVTVRLLGLPDLAAPATEAAEDAAAPAGPEAVAACLRERGDALLTPLGSPETLGYDLDSRETPAVLGDAVARDAAARYYAAAAELVGEGVWSGLRRAARHHADGRHGEAVAALDGVLGDALGDQRPLLLTHLALQRVLGGDLASSRPGPVEEIAAWCRERGGPAYGLGCAGLVHAAGCEARERGRIDEALALLDLAKRLHAALGDDTGALTVEVSRGELYDRLRCRGATIATIEETWEAAVAGLPQAGALELIPWTRLAQLVSWLGAQVMAERDLEGFAVVRARIVDLLARAPGPLPEPAGGDLLTNLAAQERDLAELGAARAGPRGGGLPFDESARRNLEATALGLRNTHQMCTVMEPDVRAVIALDRGDDAAARRAFDEALTCAEESGGPSLVLFVLLGRDERAELARRLDALRDSGVGMGAEYEAGFRLEARQPEEAAALLAGADAVEPPPPDERWSAQWAPCLLRARIALAAGRLDDAERLAREGVARFDGWFAAVTTDTFRVSSLDDPDVRRLHDVLAEIAHRRGDGAAALHDADRVRSLALGALVADSLVEGAGSAAVRRRREAHATWNGMFDRRRAARRSTDPDALSRTAADLAAAQAELDVAVAAAPLAPSRPLPGVDAAELAAALDADTLLVHYTITDDALLVTTVDRDGLDVVRHPVRARTLRGLAARLHRTWASGAPVAREDLAAATAAVLAPVEARLSSFARLVVVPDAALHTLPFAALEIAGEPVGAHHAISQLPAAALVPHLAGRPRARLERGVAVVGDPVAGDEALPGARVEALTVARMLGTAPLLGERADEISVRAAMAHAGGLVHLATHGRLDEQAPDLSSLALAGGDELTVAELLGMGLDTDLAVLSACDSGRGEITQGGDVVGLARGLIAAGARHAVVTLWPVDDRVACLVMVGFVARLVDGHAVSAALASAQREVRALSEPEREERYRDLAARAGSESATAVRRGGSLRDARLPERARVDDRHPTWWAPFVHVGL